MTYPLNLINIFKNYVNDHCVLGLHVERENMLMDEPPNPTLWQEAL